MPTAAALPAESCSAVPAAAPRVVRPLRVLYSVRAGFGPPLAFGLEELPHSRPRVRKGLRGQGCLTKQQVRAGRGESRDDHNLNRKLTRRWARERHR